MNISLHVDYADEVILSDSLYDEAKIASLMQTAAANGVQSINWRAEAVGRALYPSQIAIPASEFNIEEAENPEAGWVYPPGHAFDSYEILASRIKAIFNKFDPIKVAYRHARENGLKFNVYICPFDQYWPGRTGRVLQKYPYAKWMSREGNTTMPMISMAYPEVREYLLQAYAELLAYDFDDLYVYLGCHGWYGFPDVGCDDGFGFELPVVDDFKKRYGVDISKEEFDHQKWHSLKGEYYTQFLRGLYDMLDKTRQRMTVGTMLGDYNLYFRWAQPRRLCARYQLDWKEITSWGNVDLCVGDQSDIWTNSLWQSHPDMLGSDEKLPYEFIDDFYGPAEARNFKLYVFRALHHKMNMSCELEDVRKAWGKFTANGIVVREAAELEFYGDNWKLLSILQDAK